MAKLLTAKQAKNLTEVTENLSKPSQCEIKKVNRAIQKACKNSVYRCYLGYEISNRMRVHLEINGYIVNIHRCGDEVITDIRWG